MIRTTKDRERGHTMVMSFRMLSAELEMRSLEQMNSVRVGSSSPMYSTIFLLIQGLMRRSISDCNMKESTRDTSYSCTV